MTEVIVTRSARNSAATTLHGEVRYEPVRSERAVTVGHVVVGEPASDEATQELRRRLREGR